jgi:hypothetical protein
MAKKRHSQQTDRKSTLHHASVPKRQPASTKAFAACRSLESPRAVIDFLGFSYSDVGSEYGRITGSKPVSKQAIYKMISAPRISDGLLQTLGQLVSNRLTRMCGVTVGVTILQNSPLHVTPFINCPTCREMFPIDRPGVRNCPRCR